MKKSDSEILHNLTNLGYMVLYQRQGSDAWHMKGASYGYPYGYEWSARRYGKPYWISTVLNWCIMDMSKGEIVWRSWEESSHE